MDFRQKLFSSVVLVAATGAFGCSGPVENDVSACPTYQCGNSPIIDVRGTHEFNLDGVAGAGGFSYAGTVDAEQRAWQLSVADGVVTAHRGSELRTDLTGLTTHLRSAKGEQVAFTFAAAPTANRYWTAAKGEAQAYALRWSDGSAECQSAYFFEGDRVDAERRTLSASSDRWVNLACEGTALAKLHLSGHSSASQSSTGVVRSTQEGQAFLKMMSADYCGTGASFTVAGHPLSYRSQDGVLSSGRSMDNVEAQWSESGAVCLNTPRHVGRAAVGCAIPACGSDTVGHLVSAR